MQPIAVIAKGAVSPLGVASAAFSVGELDAAPETKIAAQAELAHHGFRRPMAARVAIPVEPNVCRARALLRVAVSELTKELADVHPSWRSERIALVIGTSGGAMTSLCEVLRQRAAGRTLAQEIARRAPYFAPLSVLAELGVEPVFSTQLLAACASSTMAIGYGCRLLELERADLVIAGGYDAASLFIAAGFEALGATTASIPSPFRAERDGMALGEGAALVALKRAAETNRGFGYVLGFGASSDAVHITAPDREARGLASAARSAIDDACLLDGDINLISAHATATPFNDAAEARAISQVLGSSAERAYVHPFKAVIGHTLGAAGALESLAALDALRRNIAPGAIGSGPQEPALTAKLVAQNEPREIGECLKLSTAFGGSNAALILGARPNSSARVRVPNPVVVAAIGEARTQLDPEELLGIATVSELTRQRLDSLSELVIAAAASAVRKFGQSLPARTGVVVASAAATIEVNEVFAARLRARGVTMVEPRRFPATSPNLCAGQCSIAFGLHGPSLSVGAGPDAALEGLIVAYDLLAAGDADALIVVAAEDVGPVVTDIWRAAGLPLPERAARAVLLRGGPHGAQISREKLDAARASARKILAESPQNYRPGWPSMIAALE